jgi:hypothetical protein
VLGLNKGRVDTDGTGKLGERGSGNIDALALHLETNEVAIWDVSLIPRMAGEMLESPNLRRLLAHRSVEPVPSHPTRQPRSFQIDRPILDSRLTRSMHSTR